MLNTVKISSCELINADCLEFIRSLPENSVDLIVTDPPYFKVKPEGWDNQWKGDDGLRFNGKSGTGAWASCDWR